MTQCRIWHAMRRARPSARQPTGGPPSRPIALARLGLIRPGTPRSSHGRRIRSDGRPPLPRDPNPPRRRSPSNPRSFSPRLLSPRERRQPRSGGDGQAERAGRRRRARSPEGERAAVELAVDGARLSSPACATPASRSSKSAASLCRDVRPAAAQTRPAHRRRQ